MKFGKVLFGVGLGVLAGLLFAPKKGSELKLNQNLLMTI